MENIIKHFNKYLPLDDAEKEALTGRLTERKIKSKQFIVGLKIKECQFASGGDFNEIEKLPL